MRDRLGSSFLRVIGAYQAVQFAVFLAYSLPFGFFGRYALPFAASSLCFHGLVLYLLFLFRSDFVKEATGERLDHVNLANLVTLFRLSTLPTVLFVIVASKDYAIRYPLIALVAVVFATDALDGYISRKGREVTRIGRMMDSASDYALLFVISLVYHYFGIIPVWFLGLLVARLAGQSLMVLAIRIVKKRIEPRTSFLGKATVAGTMFLYGFELLRFVADLPTAVYAWLEYAVGAVVAASIVDKIALMIQELRRPAPVATEPAPNGQGETHADQERARDSAGENEGSQG